MWVAPFPRRWPPLEQALVRASMAARRRRCGTACGSVGMRSGCHRRPALWEVSIGLLPVAPGPLGGPVAPRGSAPARGRRRGAGGLRGWERARWRLFAWAARVVVLVVAVGRAAAMVSGIAGGLQTAPQCGAERCPRSSQGLVGAVPIATDCDYCVGWCRSWRGRAARWLRPIFQGCDGALWARVGAASQRPRGRLDRA